MRVAGQPGFLDLPADVSSAQGARVHVLPVPYEATVSYEEGTRDGPAAIIDASHEVELYDPETDDEPALSWGVHTLPALAADWPDGQTMMRELSAAAENAARAGRFLCALGGEHSITPALIRGVRRVHPGPLTVVQIDAHADLRDEFRGSRFSHACAMRRVLEENPGPTVQIGIRSYSAEEAAFIREYRGRISIWTPEMLRAEDHDEILRRIRAALAGRSIYLTIDVDGIDPSIVPATGTPEPDGLSWPQACEILRTVAAAGRVIAMDCVELAPRPGLHMAAFSVAKLLYRTLSWIMAAESSSRR